MFKLFENIFIGIIFILSFFFFQIREEFVVSYISLFVGIFYIGYVIYKTIQEKKMKK